MKIFRNPVIRIMVLLCFILAINIGNGQNASWNIQFEQSSLSCSNDQVCYELSLQRANATNWALGDQNYRLFFDGDLMTVTSVTSLLPNAFYDPAIINQNITISGQGQDLASPLDDIDDNLGFLDFNIIQSNRSNPAGATQINTSFTAVAEICVDVDPSVINDPLGNTCLSFYHSRPSTAGTFTNQYTVLTENNAPGTTVLTTGVGYDDLTSADGAIACLGLDCFTCYTNGGTIAGDESSCGSFDPANITSTTLPSGGTGGTLVYRWQYRNGTSGGYTVIDGATGATYDPPTISQTRQYRRQARNVSSCPFVTSLPITKEVKPLPNVTSTPVQDATCDLSNGSITFNFTDEPTRGALQFSIDGGQTWSSNVADDSGSYTIADLAPDTYDLQVRWAAPDCPVDLADVTINSVGENYTDPGTIDGAEEGCGSYDPSLILSTSPPSGGNGAGGSVEYQWQSSTDGGVLWTDISGVTSAQYNPPVITETTAYRRGARRSNCGTYVYTTPVTKTVDARPNVTSTPVQDATCGLSNGSITFNFMDESSRTTIEFSIDGGMTWPPEYAVPDDTGSFTISDLSPDTYDLRVRWGNEECPVNLADVTISNVGSNFTDGGMVGNDEEACGDFDPANIFNMTLPSGGSGGTTEYQWQSSVDGGTTWIDVAGATNRGYDPPVIMQTTQYRRGALRTPCMDYVYSNEVTKEVKPLPNVTSTPVQDATCDLSNGSITFNFTDEPTRGALQFSTDGGQTWSSNVADDSGSYTIADLAPDTYDLQVRWAAPECPVDLADVTINSVGENYTDSGTIDGAEEGCGSYDPSLILSTSPPSGGNGAGGSIEYQWQSSTDGGVLWTDISGVTGAQYNPPVITETTAYRRGARRSNCGAYLYTASIEKIVEALPNVTSTPVGDATCGLSNGSITFNFADDNIRTTIEFSIDGGVTWPPEYAVPDDSGSFTINDLAPDTYDLHARWGNEECPVDLADVTISNVGSNYTDAGAIDGAESVCGSYDPSTITFTAPPSGGSGGSVEYQWQSSTDGGTIWMDISGATMANYDPPMITQTAVYRRGARRSGCMTYLYTDEVTKEVKALPNVTSMPLQDATCDLSNGSITFNFTDEPTRGALQFSIDGGQTWSSNVADDSGSYTIADLAPDTYDLQVRWAAPDCPVDLADVTINSVGENYTDPGTIDGAEEGCGSYDPSLILSTSPPSGGNGAGGSVEYQWQSSTDGGVLWTDISGVTGAQYNPPVITETTAYRRGARRSNCGTYVYTTSVMKTVDARPNVTSTPVQDATCGLSNGSITFNFMDESSRTTIEFSIDGGMTWPPEYAIPDDTGSFTISDLSPDTYDLRVRWGNEECPVNLADVTISNVGSNFTDGGMVGNDEEACGDFDPANIFNMTFPSGGSGGTIEYQWQSSVDGGTTWTDVVGADRRGYDPPAIMQTTHYRRGALRTPCMDYVYSNEVTKEVKPLPNVTSTPVQDATCDLSNGSITFNFTDEPTRGALQFSTDGGQTWSSNVADNSGSYTIADLAPDTYDLQVRWAAPECPVDLADVTINSVGENYTDPGTIDGAEEECGSYDPSLILSTSPPSGGNGAGGSIEYQWQSSTDGGVLWADISGVTGAQYNPPVITETTVYRRGARRSNCGAYLYTASIEKTVEALPNVTSTPVQDATCGLSNGSITFNFIDESSRTTIEFSIDGGMTWPPEYAVPDDTGSFTISDLSPDTYDLRVRWGNEECPVDLADVTIGVTGPVDCDGDGVLNEDEVNSSGPNDPATDPTDPCDLNLSEVSVPATDNGDCDGDGVPNDDEINSDGPNDPQTDPNDPCDLNLVEQSLTPSPAWDALDCDGDGNDNETDPHPLVPTAVDDMFMAPVGSATSYDILENDDFLENDGNIITRVGGTAGGMVDFNPITGDIIYTPLSSEGGTNVTVIYRVCQNTVCAEATVIITVQNTSVPCNIDIALWLEGVYEPSSDEMRTDLNDQGLLPGQDPTFFLGQETSVGQPYQGAPWLYPGTEGDAFDYKSVGDPKAGYDPDVVDWVLVSLRSGTAANTMVCQEAALLMKDGTVMFPDGCNCSLSLGQALYVVVEHRSHLPVMSPNPVVVTNAGISFDFRNTQSFLTFLGDGQQLLEAGVYGMFAANGDQSNSVGSRTDINATDESIWTSNNSEGDIYNIGDFNLDGDVNANDESLWLDNTGKSSDVNFN